MAINSLQSVHLYESMLDFLECFSLTKFPVPDLEKFLSSYCEEVCEVVLEHGVVLQVIVGEERDPHISWRQTQQLHVWAGGMDRTI